MKTYIRLIAFLLIIGLTYSCDDYLKTESNSTFTEETAFSNLDFAKKAVFSIYNSLTTSYMWDNYLVYYRCDTDIEQSNSANNSSYVGIAHYAADEGNTTLQGVWNTFYSTIEKANICIDNLPNSPVWEGEYAEDALQLYGEAVTLRAYLYWELINIWGDVPFITKSTQAGDDFYVQKTDRDSIYEYLIQDLKDVEDYVPWMRETQTAERVNKGFVKGLRSRMALSYAGYSLRNKTFETRRGRYWQEYYKIANQECKEIMESGKHRLNPSFENIFKTLHQYNQDLTYNESMFEVAFLRLYSGRFANQVGMYHSYSPADPKYGRAVNQLYSNPVLYYNFDKKDIRRDVSFQLYNYASTSHLGQQWIIGYTAWSFCKWRKSWIVPLMGGDLKDAYYTGVNFPLMRYSDIILMFAETENEINGPTAAAKEALTRVRQRAFSEDQWAEKVTHYVDSVSVSKESFFNAIVDERAFEFVGEFYRKYDLVRWNLLGEKINKLKEEYAKILNNDPKYKNVPNYIFWRHPDGGEVIEILNPDYRLPSTSIAGYSKTSWYAALNESSKATYLSVMGRVANGYDPAKNNHLMPLAATTISASRGILSNDQIP